MPLKSVTKLMVACITLLSLTACGNDPQARRGADTVKELAVLAKSRLLGEKPEQVEAADPVAMIDYALRAAPDAPLQFILMEKSGGFAVSTVQGINGQNVTWISPDKKSITLKVGLLAATRGFGGDVMSIEQGGADRLVSGRRSGQVQKTYRFLNGLDQTGRFIVTCDVAAGATDHVSSGEISAPTRVMTETCKSEGGTEFTNTYWVDASGRMVQSIQWAGPDVGKIVFRQLRF
ncbi:YjbF family lipoprotein [Pacificibacter sp. AS14]|uniref:YjbF family lipoprotein n=1 Tax=Pacificibacter sp. AS14 TaxID=3135785 RepID=UPI00317DCCB8